MWHWIGLLDGKMATLAYRNCLIGHRAEKTSTSLMYILRTNAERGESSGSCIAGHTLSFRVYNEWSFFSASSLPLYISVSSSRLTSTRGSLDLLIISACQQRSLRVLVLRLLSHLPFLHLTSSMTSRAWSVTSGMPDT